AFFITCTLMENHPDQTAELMGDGSNRLIVAQTRQQPPIKNLKDTAFELDCGVGTLAKQTAHISIAFWAAVAAGHSCTLFVSGTCADPRSKVFVRRKCCSSGADFGNDLVR